MTDEQKPPSRYAVFYHKNCTDGFGAAWAAYKLLEDTAGQEVLYNPIDWGRQIDIPLLKDVRVFFFDISVDRTQLEQIEEIAEFVEVWDHHKTTSDQMADMECVNIDQSKSGAVLAWNRCAEECEKLLNDELSEAAQSLPELLKYVQDNDLWKKQLPMAEEFASMIQSYPYDFKVWDEINATLHEKIEYEGSVILRADRSRMKERIIPLSYEIELCDQKMTAVNSPIFPSELGNLMIDKHGVGLVWYCDGDSLLVSLRSKKPDGVDVAAIANNYGGGGHQSAAGFRVSADSKLAKLIMGAQEEE